MDTDKLRTLIHKVEEKFAIKFTKVKADDGRYILFTESTRAVKSHEVEIYTEHLLKNEFGIEPIVYLKNA